MQENCIKLNLTLLNGWFHDEVVVEFQVKCEVARHLEMHRVYKVEAVRYRLEKEEGEVEVEVKVVVEVVKEVAEK